jgi:hypothetical protein
MALSPLTVDHNVGIVGSHSTSEIVKPGRVLTCCGLSQVIISIDRVPTVNLVILFHENKGVIRDIAEELDARSAVVTMSISPRAIYSTIEVQLTQP